MAPVITSPDSYKKILEDVNYHQVLKNGNRIDISGQGGWGDLTNGYSFQYKSLEEEIEQAFKNVEHVLSTVGASWKDVYSVTSYHTNFAETSERILAKFSALFRQYIGERAPLWTSIGVTSLAIKGMNVEIVVSAIKD
ncbi:hypothetical protein G6F46_011483 [Rhizopus delemar]|uniref:Uncharacterized protein n=2 Tax=Rhizopus TaxID=4842 RepID=I1CCJ3_RHIO9|nr:hypothetical protein RO3G_10884 [Rhizopus delemar RA 99-880]KAG1448249.1 hypothetical protein G6F55_010733 [Rhizopus delemar]KAG1535357.1 hypothetical protein G6F51_011581 [Rhizopus arrhizus]KAG1489759.1 hypothetical protein G6F54_011207 [Rhizopus delemar]KAG1528124.1 hypothetical protein G6F52_000926 [Rhizopus delemar]|eukprot:EIE86173.1 hypothetical protein RO3G_10884 [Rhizopus delemar RA 99-880]